MSQTLEPFGKYILLEKLATGGMAEVYLAKNPGIGISKFVAIKRILPQYSENENFIEMFKGEAKIAVNLSHSNIVSIHEFGVEREQFFIVMDYVEGRNLRQILNKLKKNEAHLSIEQMVYIIKEVAAGLDHAHRCLDGATGKPLNIIHRDMSPQNVMVSFEGEVKVVDFGIAKAETQLETTRAGELKGKFGYMSPEQAEGVSVDLRTDIFSLGIVLWEMLANDRLFIANNEINTLRKIRECQVPSLRKINPNIPQELERICSMALAKDRNLRYQTAAALHRELNRFMNRQFPDFSPHDFAVFVKTLYASEILETRKRLIEYASIEAKSKPDSPSAALAQATVPAPQASPPPPPPPPKAAATSPPPAPAAAKPQARHQPPAAPPPQATSVTRTQRDEPSFSDSFSRAGASADFGEEGLAEEARRQRAETEARAKAKADAEAAARAADLAKRPPPINRPRDSEPQPKAPPQPSPSPRAAKAVDDYSLAVDTGSWHNRRPPREGTMSAYDASSGLGNQTNYNYTVTGRYYSSRRRPSVRARLTSTALICVAGALVASAIWAMVDNKGFKRTTEPAATWLSNNLRPFIGPIEAPAPSPQAQTTSSASYSNLKVTSSPSGAKIWVDGRPQKDSTPTDIDVSEGSHDIRVWLDGYIQVEHRIVIPPGGARTAAVHASLRLEKPGYLTVDVANGPADIWIDGQKVAEAVTTIPKQPVMPGREVVVRAVKRDNPSMIREARITAKENAVSRLRIEFPGSLRRAPSDAR